MQPTQTKTNEESSIMSSQHDEFVELCALEGHRDCAWHVSWRFDGKLLASCSGDKTIRLWAPPKDAGAKWECVTILEDAQGRTIRACEWCVLHYGILGMHMCMTTVCI